jgi:hypothetical protein
MRSGPSVWRSVQCNGMIHAFQCGESRIIRNFRHPAKPTITSRRRMARRVSGACQDTRRSKRPCATTASTHSVFPDSMSPPKFTPVEPP